eukprot:COSAG05_NODE_2401_length_3105_cov_49.631684_4_plen_141_part_00
MPGVDAITCRQVGGFEKVFELGRVLRNEGISPRHNPEFTSLEVYEAYTDYFRMMTLLEDLVSSVATSVCGGTALEYSGRPLNLSPPWRRASMASLVEEATGLDFTVFPDIDTAIAAADPVLESAGKRPCAAAGVITSVCV